MHTKYLWISRLIFAALVASASTLIAGEDLEDDVDEIYDRVDALELRFAKNKINVFGDFRVRYDNQQWKVPAYNQFMGMDFTDPTAPTPVYMPVPAQELKNTEAWSARLRLKLDAKVSRDVHFTGRLNMHRGFGAASVPIFNGFPNTVFNSFNSTALPTDNVLRVERAAMTWDPDWAPFFITAGRQAATNGPPRELREDRVRQGTPGALMIDAEIDGFMLGLHLNALGAPDGSIVRFCYGTGFESGFGSGGVTHQTIVTTYVPDLTNPAQPGLVAIPNFVSGLKDSKVIGGCGESSLPFVPGETLLSAGYFRLVDMTDIPYGLTRGFPNMMNTQEQIVTATANLGDMDLYGVCFQNRLDFDGYEVDWFASWAGNKSHPDPGTASLYGFGSLLGSDREDKTGAAYYVGIRGDIPPTRGKLGVEFNHGDRNWFSYTPAADDVNSKLATRGSVFEAYYIQPLNDDGLRLRTGFQKYEYDYAFSGWHISPAGIENFDLSKTPSMPYPFPDEIKNLYLMMDLDF